MKTHDDEQCEKVERLWTDEDVAVLLSSTLAAIRAERAAAKREKRKANLPPHIRIGQRVRYRQIDVRLWLMDHEEAS